jgi:hypothetical protein
MNASILFTISFLIISQNAFADRHEFFSGEAKENGKLVYIEKHDVTFDDQNKVLEAQTTYVDPQGKSVAVLNSDFRKSLSLPEHTFEDLRTKNKYGIRRDQNKIILFNQDYGQPEEAKELLDNNDKTRVQVGCQGFNYFLKDKIEELSQIKSLPVLFMIPGDLSTYKFTLNYIKKNADQAIEFKVKIESLWLRMFAPELEFHYDTQKQRIFWYKGISNIKNDKGQTMNVVIDYKYK